MRTTILSATILLLACAAVWAATPPDAVHYQGVLRNAADEPLDGPYDMQFRFFSAETGGDYILVDRHENKTSGAVTVSGGLFTVALGTGTIADGNGPGTYTSLSEVFRDYSSVFLEIHIGFVDVGPEILSPRVPIRSGSFALNADHLDGVDSSQLIRGDSSDSFDSGTLTMAAGTVLDVDGSVEAAGPVNTTGAVTIGGALNIDGAMTKATTNLVSNLNADYLDGLESIDFASVVHGHGGNDITSAVTDSLQLGGQIPGFYLDTSATAQTKSGGLTVNHNSLTNAVAITGSGYYAGAYFEDSTDGSYAYVGHAGSGIEAYGSRGGYFESSASGYAHLGYGDDGLEARGNHSGGLFSDRDSSGYAYVGYSTYKIQGSGIVSFVQNHPEDPERVIVYAAPEGDEAATYTRGTARLVDGYTRIPLGKTFRWVTNPDLGLTAYVTPREDCNGLLVESIGTDAITVRELGGGTSDVAFDYIVYGLRIGFEEVSIVQEKVQEARIPSMKDHRDRYASDPSLASYNAKTRFLNMDANIRGIDATDLDFSRGEALRDKIQEYDPAVHGPMVFPRNLTVSTEFTTPAGTPAESEPTAPKRTSVASRDAASTLPVEDLLPVVKPVATNTIPVAETVRQGELLVIDPAEPGLLRRSTTAADTRVIGIAQFDAARVEGSLQVTLQESLITKVVADASYGIILPGDLLVSSPTPGHAMVGVAPPPGAVFAKALERLDAGTGVIKVVLMSR